MTGYSHMGKLVTPWVVDHPKLISDLEIMPLSPHIRSSVGTKLFSREIVYSVGEELAHYYYEWPPRPTHVFILTQSIYYQTLVFRHILIHILLLL